MPGKKFNFMLCTGDLCLLRSDRRDCLHTWTSTRCCCFLDSASLASVVSVSSLGCVREPILIDGNGDLMPHASAICTRLGCDAPGNDYRLRDSDVATALERADGFSISFANFLKTFRCLQLWSRSVRATSIVGVLDDVNST